MTAITQETACESCDSLVLKAVDAKYGTDIILEQAPRKLQLTDGTPYGPFTGQFILDWEGKATWWGPTGGRYRKHLCEGTE